jgi:hypothetical protein
METAVLTRSFDAASSIANAQQSQLTLQGPQT